MDPYAKPKEQNVGAHRPKIRHVSQSVKPRTRRERQTEKEGVAAQRRAIKKGCAATFEGATSAGTQPGGLKEVGDRPWLRALRFCVPPAAITFRVMRLTNPRVLFSFLCLIGCAIAVAQVPLPA